MIRQLFKLIWKQRKYNSLLVIEIAFSFIAIVALLATCIHYLKRYNEPRGMDYENIWILSAHQPWNLPPEQRIPDSLQILKMDEFKKFIKNNYNEVLAVSKVTMFDYIYSPNSSSNCFDYENRSICCNTSPTEPDLAVTFGMKIIEGRWIMEEDQIQNIEAVVINKKLKNEIFGNVPAAGKVIYRGKKDRIPLKVVGVFEALKKNGEFDVEPNFMLSAKINKEYCPFSGIAIRLSRNSNKDLEERMIKDLSSINKTYEFGINKLDYERNYYIKAMLAPLILVGAVILFLVVNVMLGLFGTLWLNISRRKSEIGLRRAVGSTKSNVAWQILGETYVLALISIAIGLVFTSQVFIFNIFNTPVSTLVEGNIAAILVIFVLSTISAISPSHLAASMQPAQALHED